MPDIESNNVGMSINAYPRGIHSSWENGKLPDWYPYQACHRDSYSTEDPFHYSAPASDHLGWFSGGIDFSPMRNDGTDVQCISGWRSRAIPARPEDGEDLSSEEFETRLTGTVAAMTNNAGAVEFDLFSNQTGGAGHTSYVTLWGTRHRGVWVRDFTIALPEIDLSSRDVGGTMNQLGNFLQQNTEPPIPELHGGVSATIFQDVPYLSRSCRVGRVPGGWAGASCISGRMATFIEDIVDAFVGESTADTLDEYSTTIPES